MAKVNEIEAIINAVLLDKPPLSTNIPNNGWRVKQLRRRLMAFEKKQVLKCLEYLMANGNNENAQSAWELWVKAGKP